MTNQQQNQPKWADMSHEQRLSYLEINFKNKVLFSYKLLEEYIQQLNKKEVQKKAETITLVEYAYKDRIIKLRDELNITIEFITDENETTEKQNFLKPLTDFGKMKKGVE